MEAEGRPPTCHHLFPPQPSTINSLPSNIHPARPTAPAEKALLPDLSSDKDFTFQKRELGLPRGLERPSHAPRCPRKPPFSFPPSRWENDSLSSLRLPPNAGRVKRPASGYPGGQRAAPRRPLETPTPREVPRARVTHSLRRATSGRRSADQPARRCGAGGRAGERGAPLLPGEG